MTDDASGAPARVPAPVPASAFMLRQVSPATAEERLTREEGMARVLRFGATPYRDGADKARMSSSRTRTWRRSSPGCAIRAPSAAIAGCRSCARRPASSSANRATESRSPSAWACCTGSRAATSRVRLRAASTTRSGAETTSTTASRCGLAAADLVVEQVLRGEAGVLVNAMHRRDVGPITFLFGKPGVPDRKYRKGDGLSHIIAKHGAEVIDDVVETIAKGVQVQRPGYGGGGRIVLHHRGHEVVLSLYRGQDRETWLLTGYKTGVTDINFDLSQLKGAIFFKPN